MSEVTANGRPQRKTLATQLDRLETLIDNLSEGLNEVLAKAIHQAVRQGVQESAQAVIAQILTSQEMLNQLAFAPASAPIATHDNPSLMSESRWGVGQLCGWVGAGLAGVKESLGDAARAAWRHRTLAAVAAALGLTLGVGGYLAGPLVASLALGVSTAALGLGTILASPFVEMWKSLQPQEG